MAVNKNRWTTFVESPYPGEFSIEFDKFSSIEQVFEFVEEIIQVSKQNDICIIDIDQSSIKYIDYLKAKWEYDNVISPFHLAGYKHYSGYVNEPFTRLSFYENGTIVEAFVSEICNTLDEPSYIKFSQNNRLLISEEVNLSKSDSSKNLLQPPVKFDMNTFRKGVDPKPVWGLSGKILSDIWFKETSQRKIWNAEGSDYVMSSKMDNSELSDLNGPRLYAFLDGLKQISKDYRGSWYFDSPFEELSF